jgi:Xaa-Pro aminopeptidase
VKKFSNFSWLKPLFLFKLFLTFKSNVEKEKKLMRIPRLKSGTPSFVKTAQAFLKTASSPVSVDVSKERISKVQDWLKAQHLDGALFNNMKNIAYLTGFAPAGVDPGEAFLLITPKEAILLTSPFYIEKAKRTAPHVAVSTQKLSDFLHEKINGACRLGIEKDSLTASQEEFLAKTLPGVLFSDMQIVEKMRETKTPEEIKALKKAAAITALAMYEVAQKAKPGITEKELVKTFKKSLLENGVEEAFVTIIAGGPDGAEPHFDEPSEKPLKPGEPLVMDVGAKVDGYNADITRMIVLGKPSPEVQKILDLVAKAQQEAISQIAPGLPIREIDLTARKVIEQAGYGKEFYHATGHGVGMDVHEKPLVSPNTPKEAILKPGNVITVEPGVYLKGKFGVRLEDMVLVTPQGHEVLSGYIPKIFYAKGDSFLEKLKQSWHSIAHLIFGGSQTSFLHLTSKLKR